MRGEAPRVDFLFVTKAGFCEQFSSAFASITFFRYVMHAPLEDLPRVLAIVEQAESSDDPAVAEAAYQVDHSDAAHTYCPRCGQILIRRTWHDVLQNSLRDGACPSCHLAIPGRWTSPPGAVSSARSQLSGNIAAKYDTLNL